jgi:hypothetical protein
MIRWYLNPAILLLDTSDITTRVYWVDTYVV